MAKVLIAFAYNNMMVKWLALANIIGPIKRNRNNGTPTERKSDGGENRITASHARKVDRQANG